MYSFDSYGWLSAEEIPNRTTSIEPPQHGDKIVGEPYPNFISPEQGWAMPNYSEPPVPDPKPAERSAILAQLANIDVQSESPRAKREAALGNVTWLASLDAQAAALRAQLKAL